MLLVGVKTSPTILKSCLTYSKVEDTHIVFVEHQTEKKFKWMDERRVCSHHGILYSTEKKITTTTQKNIESQNHSVEWKKSTKEYKLYDSIYVKFKLYLMMPA